MAHDKSYSCDAVILGSGMAGLGVAIALAGRGKKVIIISRRKLKGISSPAAGGILDPLLEMHPSSPLLPLTRAAYKGWPVLNQKLEKQTGVRTGYRRLGMLYLAFNRKEESLLRARWRWHRQTGVPVRPLPAAKIRKWVPDAASDFRSSLFYPSIARVQPGRLLKACQVLFRRRQGRVIHGEVSSVLIERGRVKGVKVGRKVFYAPVVVNATGSWAGVNRRLGPRPQVIPARGQILIFRNRRFRIPTILHGLDGGYIVPWEQDRYLTGSTVEHAGFSARVTRAGVRRIRRRIEKLVPGLKTLKPVDSWAGLRPYSRDHFPWIGRTGVEGLYMACGYFRVGILISMLAGELLAQGIVTGKMPKLIKPFSPERRFGGKIKIK